MKAKKKILKANWGNKLFIVGKVDEEFGKVDEEFGKVDEEFGKVDEELGE